MLVVAFLLGIRNAVDMPTRQAFAVEMVGREDIGNAVALNSAMFNGARVIGPAVAGITIGAFGVAPAFLLDAISYLAVIVALLQMREPDLHTRAGHRPARVGLGGVRDTCARGSATSAGRRSSWSRRSSSGSCRRSA